MKYLKADEAGNIVSVINSNVFNAAPEGYFAVDTVEDDLVLIECRFIKNGQLLERDLQPTPNHVWDIVTESWLLDLTALRHSQSFKVDQACKLAIVSGFVSYALGDPYQYPSKTTDQQNLAASVLDSYDPDNNSDWTTPFWCSNEAREWAFRPHTAAQIREVGRDAKSAILAAQFKNERLQAAITASITAEDIELVIW